MPILKTSFARIRGIGEGQLSALASRLKKVTFANHNGVQVVGLDPERDSINVELVLRSEREGRRFDDSEGKLVTEKRFEDKILYFTLDARNGVISTPQGKRDLAMFVDLLKQCGSGQGTEMVEVSVDVAAWTEAMIKMYDSAQLGNVTFEQFYVEPKMIGRFSAKTVDNRLQLEHLKDQPGRIRSLKLSFFHDGVRRSTEARADGVLTVSSGDEEDLEHFYREQRQLFLGHAGAKEAEEAF